MEDFPPIPIPADRRLLLPQPLLFAGSVAAQLSATGDDDENLDAEVLFVAGDEGSGPAEPEPEGSGPAEPGPSHALFWGLPAEQRAEAAKAAAEAAAVAAGDVGALLEALGPMSADAVLATYEGLDTGSLYGEPYSPRCPPPPSLPLSGAAQ